jgi:hypothetical protein
LAEDRQVTTNSHNKNIADIRLEKTEPHVPAGQANMTPEHQSAAIRREGTV